MALDQQKLDQLLGKALSDFGATFHAALIRIGDRLGLYKALAAGGPQTSAELAKRTGTTERSRMARQPGRWRLRHLRSCFQQVQPD
jgi:hypothetical protein